MASTYFNPIKLENLKIAIKNDKRFKKKFNKEHKKD